MDAQPAEGRLDAYIAATRAAFVAALERGDARTAASVYAEGARLLPPSAELMVGREAIEAFWEAGVESGITRVELESLDLDRHEGLVHEIGRYALWLAPADGEAVVERGKYLVAHARQPDGSWRWAVEMFSPDGAPAGSPASGGERKEES